MRYLTGASMRLRGLLRALDTSAGCEELPVYAQRVLTMRISRRWWRRAACASADPEAWFPHPRALVAEPVTRVCARCPVRKACLATALLSDEQGVWGGTRRGQRLQARKRIITGDDPGQVFGWLLSAPMPVTEYATTTEAPSRPDPAPSEVHRVTPSAVAELATSVDPEPEPAVVEPTTYDDPLPKRRFREAS